MKTSFFLCVSALFVFYCCSHNVMSGCNERIPVKENVNGYCSHKLDSLNVVSSKFSAIMDSLITEYSKLDSSFFEKKYIIKITFFERNSEVYFLAGASCFYSNTELSNAIGYLYFRDVFILVNGDKNLLFNGILEKSTNYNNFEYNPPDSNEESLKIDDDTFPGYLYKKKNGDFEMVK